jgi:hypothetical protein
MEFANSSFRKLGKVPHATISPEQVTSISADDLGSYMEQRKRFPRPRSCRRSGRNPHWRIWICPHAVERPAFGTLSTVRTSCAWKVERLRLRGFMVRRRRSGSGARVGGGRDR